MLLIRNLVQQALSTGYLTIEAEEQLRQMLAKKYDREDLKAFMTLQKAAMTGQVKQQSRELLRL
jgi:flagellar biosynthesis protein FliP